MIFNKNSYGLSRLLQLAYPERKQLALGFLALVLGSAMLLTYPQAVKYIIDEALGKGRIDLINRAAGLMLVVFVIQALAGAVRYYIFTMAGERIVARLRQTLYQSIMQQEIGFFDARRTGELMNRLASDSTVLQNAVSVNISMSMRNIGSAIGGGALLFYTSPVLTLGLMSALPPIIIGTIVIGRRIRRFARDGQDAWGESATIATETISGIRTVRAFANENYEAQRYAWAVDKAVAIGRQRIRTIALFIGLGSLLAYLTIIAVLWYGGQMVIAKEMTVGDLTSFMLYSLTVAVSVGTLGSLWTDFMSALGAAKRVFELLDRQPEIALTGGRILEGIAGQVQFQGVRFAYPSRPDITVLKNLNLTVDAGEFIALVGPSGSGKSTIAALLARFYDPDQGSVCVDGIDIRTLDSKWLRQQLAVVAQDPILLSETIAANIRYGKQDAKQEELERVARDANAHSFIMGFPEGYQTIVGERGLQLSGGQRQRVAIARAMLKNPKILILDEATSSLDAESEHLVQEALERLMQARTTFLIAHRLSTVRRADLVLVMEHGDIVQRGTHEDLMRLSEGMYYKLVNRQYFEPS